MEYFGRTWDAPVCGSTRKSRVPVGKECLSCKIEIKKTDQGVLIPYAPTSGAPYMAPWHWRCFMANILGPSPTGTPPPANLRKRLGIYLLRTTRRWRNT